MKQKGSAVKLGISALQGGEDVKPWRNTYLEAYADACEYWPGYASRDDLSIVSMEDLASALLPAGYG